MKKLIVAAVTVLLTCNLALAAESGCDAKAAEKKLAGAAKNSFIKKCEKDFKATEANTGCESKAAEKKLAGAAKNSFVKKCIKDSTAGN